jgi:DNA primase large subunit
MAPQESSSAASFHKDVASHFILRLAYCRSAELRSWLLTQESILFKHRLRELSLDEQVGGSCRAGLLCSSSRSSEQQ